MACLALAAMAVLVPADASAQLHEGTQVTPSPSASPGAPPADCAVVEPLPSPEPSPQPCPSPTPAPDDDLGPRPYGLSGLKAMFGKRCSGKANDARTYFPHAWGRGKDGYVYYHAKLAAKVAQDVLAPLLDGSKHDAFDYGIWGYSCRMKTGGTSWSVHSWGAAIDTNTLRNPYGQGHWNGKGARGDAYGKLIPNAYMSEDFYWGLNFNDPMHFQYVSGY
ncbi:MAG: M15 family metallopeptidase [Actinomycetota bacterium]